MVRRLAPGPVIVMSCEIAGRLLASMIVPLTSEKLIRLPGLALALLIASRSEPVPESLVLVTVNVVAAIGLAAANKNPAIEMNADAGRTFANIYCFADEISEEFARKDCAEIKR